MSREYVDARIREALKLTRGNDTKARAQIIAWAAEDLRLLLGLTRPHLTGIVAYAINKVQNRSETEGEDLPPPAMPQTLDMPPDSFGREILSALSSHDTPIFGQDAGAPPARPRKASQSHIDALKAIAKKTDKK